MRIAVTGGAGFIGSNLCDFLVERKHTVLCIDNFNDYYSPRMKRRNIGQLQGNSLFRLLECDVTDRNAMLKLFLEEKPDAVAHLAALPGVRASIENPMPYVSNNIAGTLSALEAAKECGVKKFVLASSSSVYGASAKIPFSEAGPADSQLSPYAFTKRSAELLCSTYNRLYGLPVACLRFFTVYGERNRPDMAVRKFTKMIDEGVELPVYGSTSLKRDYTYVGDVLPPILRALEPGTGFEVINIGNSRPVALSKLISLIESALGKKAKLRNVGFQRGDARVTCADISKARKLLNYSPKVPIEEGIKRFVRWYLEKGREGS